MEDRSSFQQELLDSMPAGKWYSVYRESGLPHPELPEWFYRRQSRPMVTIESLLSEYRVVAVRYEKGKPIVSKCYGLDKPRRADITMKGGG